ncbi:MAG: 30S ribosomal protein S24e [Euryarchaeota archaeon]|nr:30S ribosomal protein S24e [Euryarchaeota archaeon]
MNINERIENKLLNRIEISFSWRHEGKTTPSRKEIMDLVRTLEPGSNPDWIVVKECSTRFGQALTTGMAYIYSSLEAMAVEPSYIHKRHEQFRTSSPQKEESSEGGDE